MPFQAKPARRTIHPTAISMPTDSGHCNDWPRNKTPAVARRMTEATAYTSRELRIAGVVIALARRASERDFDKSQRFLRSAAGAVRIFGRGGAFMPSPR